MPDLLLELFSEEIPARMQRKAAEDLKKLVTDALVERGLVYEGARAFATEWERLCKTANYGGDEPSMAWAYLNRPGIAYHHLDPRYAGDEVGNTVPDAVIRHYGAHGRTKGSAVGNLLKDIERRLCDAARFVFTLAEEDRALLGVEGPRSAALPIARDGRRIGPPGNFETPACGIVGEDDDALGALVETLLGLGARRVSLDHVDIDGPTHAVIARTAEGHLRALVPASERIDLRKLREAAGGSKDAVQLATEAEMAEGYPEFALGAVPPVGGARRDPVIVDRRLVEHEWLVFEAGTHDDSVRMRTEDLLRIAEAQTADLCQD